MNNERYNQIVDEVYENYCKEYEKDNSVGMLHLIQRLDGRSVYHKPDIESFIALCTYDKTFSERWGLKIEERELSGDERNDLCAAQKSKMTAISEEDYIKYNIPTKLITVTYNNEKTEIYE